MSTVPYTVIEDRKGFWVMDTDFDLEVEGPFDTRREAEAALEAVSDDASERWRQRVIVAHRAVIAKAGRL